MADKKKKEDTAAQQGEQLTDAEKEAREAADVSAASTDDIEASGAIEEGDIKADIPLDHPAVDSNPRSDTTKGQNQIDFNDPTKGDEEAVKENLSKQG